jgi:hypothetical protein
MVKRKRKRWYPKPGKQIDYNVERYDRIVLRIREIQLTWPIDVALIIKLRDQLDVIWVKLDQRSCDLIIEKWGDGRGVPLLLDPRGSKTDDL